MQKLIEAVQSYCANFGKESNILGDMTLLDFRGFAKVNMVTAGFPCQPFTGAGEASD